MPKSDKIMKIVTKFDLMGCYVWGQRPPKGQKSLALLLHAYSPST